MASLTKKCRHSRSEWEQCGCQWMVRQRVGGKDTYTPAGHDLVVAERALARTKAGADETISAALVAWLTAKERDPRARPNSIAVYRSRSAHVRERLGPNSVRSIRPETLTRFVDDLLADGFAPSTVQGIYACLTATLRHAVRRGVIKSVPLPIDGPGIPMPSPRRHDLTLAQVESIVSDMPGVWGQVAELVYLTGLRWGEAVAIRPDDISGSVLHVRRTQNRYGGVNEPKTRAGIRVVPLSPRAQDLLGSMRLPVGGDYREARKALVAAMGDLHREGMGWHSIRNAHATLIETAGVTVRDQAARMGHGVNYAQTLAYGLASQAGSAEAIDAARQHAARPSSAPGTDELALRRRRSSRKAG